MKKKHKVITFFVVSLAIATIWVVGNYDRRIPFSRLHEVLKYRAEDIGAIAFAFYDCLYGDDVGFVKNIEVKLILGDKKLVKKHFDISNVPVEKDRRYIEKMYEVLNTVPKNYIDHGDMITSLNDTGLVFFTKNGKMVLAELILGSEGPPSNGKVWVAKIPFKDKELRTIFVDLFDKYKVYKIY